MSNVFSRPSSRRGLLCMGVVAVAGLLVGCGEPSTNRVESPTLAKGNKKRLDALKEQAEQAALKKKKR
jgi:hypothetical protein